ncbi:MAG TPA: Crp/Fnr family transcriptional regulator [Puia sp.]|nr:Crp/Fnr family transcriptional regulator [Puia sp.]
MNDVFDYLGQLHALSPPLKAYLEKTLKPRQYEKNSFLLQEGEVCNKVWYLRKGLVRSFYYQKDHEITTWFMDEGHALLATKSFFDRLKSHYYIEALEPCDTYYLEYPDVLYALEHYAEAMDIRTKVSDFYANLIVQRVRATSVLNAIDKYHYLEKHFPYLIGRVSLKYIASYLDMDVRTLTRIRHDRHP